MANTCSSIELEPRTLSQLQLTQAREVAAEVVQKLEPNEASALFIEGLTHPTKEMKLRMDENGGQDHKLIDCTDKAKMITDDNACHCQCSCCGTPESPDHIRLKQPISAPF